MAAGFWLDRSNDALYARPGSWPTSRSPPTATSSTAPYATGVGTTGLGRRLRRGQDGNPQRYLTVGLGGFAVAAAVFVAALAAIGGGA